MRKAKLAAVLIAAGSTLATVGAASADAAPAGTNACGFTQNYSTGRATYENCSDVGERIRIFVEFGIRTACVAPHEIKWLGGWEVHDASAYETC
jgi:hypothetical protein